MSSIIDGYGQDVVAAVTAVANASAYECKLLIEKMRVPLATTLASQRGKQYQFGVPDDKLEYEVFSQCRNVDNTPTNNIAMENRFGDVDNRMKLKPYVSTVSRDVILHQTRELRQDCDKNPKFYRTMGSALEALRVIQQEYSSEQAKIRQHVLQQKEIECMRKEQRKLGLLRNLRDVGGPFTSAEEISVYMEEVSSDNAIARSRLKDEITYARDTSKSLPRNSSFFKIMTTGSDGRRRNKTAAEYAESLKCYLGKAEHQKIASMSDFRAALELDT